MVRSSTRRKIVLHGRADIGPQSYLSTLSFVSSTNSVTMTKKLTRTDFFVSRRSLSFYLLVFMRQRLGRLSDHGRYSFRSSILFLKLTLGRRLKMYTRYSKTVRLFSFSVSTMLSTVALASAPFGVSANSQLRRWVANGRIAFSASYYFILITGIILISKLF